MCSTRPQTLLEELEEDAVELTAVGAEDWYSLENDEEAKLSSSDRLSAPNGTKGVIEIAELSSSGLNKLLAEKMNAPETKKYLIEEGLLKFKKDNKGYARQLKYYVIEKDYPVDEKEDEVKSIRKRLVFFDVTKDAETEENQPPLYPICHLIPTTKTSDAASISETKEDKITLNFFKREKEKNSIFIMPMQQCRGLFSLPPEYASKAHVVLALYYNETNEIKVYDSQGGISIPLPFATSDLHLPLPGFIYPDKFKEKSGYIYSGTTYLGIQKFPHLCGYYVDMLRACFLQDGNANRFGQIDLRPDFIILKENYMENHLAMADIILKKAANKINEDWVCLDPEDIKVKDSKIELLEINKDSVAIASTFFSPSKKPVSESEVAKRGSPAVVKPA